ncbi:MULTISPECIES: SufE family protein [Acidiphilium]|uniref:Cysteine desulfuration protein SufE n=1 Tax=Acidiphilium rubrum TaxID=526 RepID=A0A8G2CK91_ACIRU|nr:MULTISPECIES: SufE family protein [Acidiphilium]SIQ71173.1 cysteine desulfuration protein SufE [Acidiphilium rubrum]
MIDAPFVLPDQPSAAEAIAQLHEELFLFDDWMDRYQFIIELGQSLPAYPDALKTDDRLVPGCQSRVWLEPIQDDNKLYFAGASDAAIVGGLVALLLHVYSGRTPDEIRATPANFLKDWGLIGALSGNRGNGVAAMAERIQRFASRT